MNRVVLHRVTSSSSRVEEVIIDLDSVTAALPMNGRTELWIGERSLYVSESMDHFKPTPKTKSTPVTETPVAVEAVRPITIEAPKLPVKAVEKKAAPVVNKSPARGGTTSSALG